MKSMKREGYFTCFQYDASSTTKSHRIYYNDIDIETANLLCDGVVVGNAMRTDRHMTEIDKRNNYIW